MKKMILSLITMIVLGTSTGFCGTKSNNDRNQPKIEQVVSNRSVHNDKDKKNECNCKNCQKQKKQVKQKKCTCKSCQKQNVQMDKTQNHGKTRM